MLKPIVMPLVFAVTALVVVWPAAGVESTFRTHVQHAKAALVTAPLKRPSHNTSQRRQPTNVINFSNEAWPLWVAV